MRLVLADKLSFRVHSKNSSQRKHSYISVLGSISGGLWSRSSPLACAPFLKQQLVMEPVRYLVEVKEPRPDWSLLFSVIVVIAVISSFTCKRGNKVNSVLYWPFRLVCMHIIKDIWPKTDNYNNDYSNFPISISNQPSGNSSPPPPSFRVLGTKCLHDI